MSTRTRPWLDSRTSIAERVCLLMSAMTTKEKVAQMIQISYSTVTPEEADDWARKGTGSFLHVLGNDSRRLQRYATETRLGIPVIFGIDAIHGHAIHKGATVFPSQLALASSWNPGLAEKVARVTAREVAAEGLHWTFSPVFCLGRDLRWGRIDETFGEDPHLAGKMGAAMVRGYQGKDLAAADSIAACAKHYIAYGESTGGRDSYEAPVSMRALRSVFLPPFAEAIHADCLTVMVGYESVDGVPCSASKKLLRGILKDELQFDGIVVTDWMNVTSLYERQKVAADLKDASLIALEAGNDMIMTAPAFYESILSLINEGKVNLAHVDEAVARILSVKFRIGLFDVSEKVKTLTLEDDPSASRSLSIYNCTEHQQINLEAARKSITLLKNETVNGIPTLPITGMGGRPIITIAVIGPNADSVRAQFGDWTFFTHPVPNFSAVPTFRVTTMLDGIREIAEKKGITVLHDKGCDLLDSTLHTIDKACALAEKADIVFLVLGDNCIQTGEAHDRANLALTGAQNELARALRSVCDAKRIHLVSLLVNGKPLEFAEVAKASDAILETFNSGTLGGQAAAEIIFGLVNPQGRLPISFPRTTGQLPVYYNQLPGWHNGAYCDCEPTPLFAFGEGLSFTTYRYDRIELSKSTASSGETIEIRVTLTNTENVDGTETIQIYVTDRVSSVVTPVLELKAFAQIELKAGETATAAIPLNVDSLSLVTQDEKTILEKGEFEIRAGHDSRMESLLMTVLTIV